MMILINLLLLGGFNIEYYGTVKQVFSRSGLKQWFEEKKINTDHLSDYVPMLRNNTKFEDGDIIYVGGICNMPISTIIVHDF